jgi:transposase
MHGPINVTCTSDVTASKRRKETKSAARLYPVPLSWGVNQLVLLTVLKLNPLSPELNPICYLLALLAHNFLHVRRIRVKSLTLR